MQSAHLGDIQAVSLELLFATNVAKPTLNFAEFGLKWASFRLNFSSVYLCVQFLPQQFYLTLSVLHLSQP